jgi:hypothetical protein
VGCEACHGGSERWLASHASVNASHADNVAKGMWAVNDPAVKASVCLDCHFGSDKPGQFVFHRIMAAGHPRVAFELDLFTSLQRHHDEDADYAARKGVTGGVKTWAVGQALAVERALSLLPAASGRLNGPDYYFYDCRSCHRTFSDDPAAQIVARTNGWRPIPPGQPVWNDEQMIMLASAARVAAPDVARSFDNQSRAFHAALGGDRAGAIKAAATLKATAATLARRFAGTSFDRAQTFALIDAVLVGNAAAYTDYQGGAQAVMAADTWARTWSAPVPWTYEGGEEFFSPSSCSQLVTHSNGKIYWLGNVTPTNPRGNRPRFPFVIGEVNRHTGLLRKATVRTVDTLQAGENEILSLSNFYAYEHRKTREVVVHMTRLFAHADGWEGDAMRYAVGV